MLGALRAWFRPARPAATLAATIAATVMLTGSAVAAAPPKASVHAGGRSLQTLASGVRIFAAPSLRAATLGRLAGVGTGVSVTCWTTGTYFGDNPTWYRLSAPMLGFVAAFDLAAHFSPAVGVSHCPTPAFREHFRSLEVNLRIRTSPSTGATITGYLVSVGSSVTVDCFVSGSPVYYDAVWYHAVAPAAGYVAGRFLNTGGDPAPGVPRC